MRNKYRTIVILGVLGLSLVACARDAQQGEASDPASGEIGLRLVPVTGRLGVDRVGEVEIHLDNVENLYGLHLTLQFDPSVLRVHDADLAQQGVQIVPGGLPAPDFTVRNLSDNGQGTIEYAVVQLSPREPARGDGVVATIRFQGVDKGTSPLTFVQAQLSDPDGQALPVRAFSVDLEVN